MAASARRMELGGGTRLPVTQRLRTNRTQGTGSSPAFELPAGTVLPYMKLQRLRLCLIWFFTTTVEKSLDFRDDVRVFPLCADTRRIVVVILDRIAGRDDRRTLLRLT